MSNLTNALVASALFPLSFVGLVGWLVTGWSLLIVAHFVALGLAVYLAYALALKYED